MSRFAFLAFLSLSLSWLLLNSLSLVNYLFLLPHSLNFFFPESSSCIPAAVQGEGRMVLAGRWRALNIDEEALAAAFYVGVCYSRTAQLTNTTGRLERRRRLTVKSPS